MQNNAKILGQNFLMILWLIFCVCCSEARSSDRTAEELILAMKASVRQISSIEADYILTQKLLKDKPGIKTATNGEGVLCEYSWGLDIPTDSEYLEGNWAAGGNGKDYYYADNSLRYNGNTKLYKGYTKKTNSGKILKDKHLFLSWVKPFSIIGERTYPRPSLSEILEQNIKQITVVKESDSVYKLSCPYKEFAEDWLLEVWLDSRYGFLPAKYEKSNRIFKVLRRRIIVKEFKEVNPGIWFPVHGTIERFYMESPELKDGKYYSNGMTFEQIDSLPKNEQNKIIPTLGFLSKPLGNGPVTLLINKDTIKINHRINEDRFTRKDFPKGTFVWDGIKEMGYVAGRWDDPGHVPESLPKD